MPNRIVLVIFIVVALALVTTLLQATGTLTGFLARTGSLTIGNSPPEINNIWLNEENTTGTATDVTINPIEASIKNITVKAQITDTNGDCDTFAYSNGTAYLCNGTGDCNADEADHTVTLNYNSTDGQWGDNNIYCNMSGAIEAFYWHEINGTWRVNFTVTDGTNTTSYVRNWTYGETPAFGYASGGTVTMGVLTLNQWNNGTGTPTAVNNTGNIPLDLVWNASNFTGQSAGGDINITGSNYIIDDDTDSPDDSGNMPEKYINESHLVNVSFVPSSGLVRCSDSGCTNTNATFDVYWHILVPPVLPEDTYQNSIEITSSYHY